MNTVVAYRIELPQIVLTVRWISTQNRSTYRASREWFNNSKTLIMLRTEILARCIISFLAFAHRGVDGNKSINQFGTRNTPEEMNPSTFGTIIRETRRIECAVILHVIAIDVARFNQHRRAAQFFHVAANVLELTKWISIS